MYKKVRIGSILHVFLDWHFLGWKMAAENDEAIHFVIIRIYDMMIGPNGQFCSNKAH